MRKSLVLLLLLLWCTVAQQQFNPKGFILTNRLFLFDTTNGNQASNNGAAYSFNFNRNFTNVPRVGLGIVNMDFQYSPVFSCQVSSNTTESSATLLITTQTTSTTNQLYIMYLATDHDFFGVFMPGPLITYMLNQGTPDQVTQTFPFNFKSQVANSLVSNIRVSVYLTGITSSSQLVSNGYPTNHTNFFLSARVLNSANYEIDVTVSSQYGDISISQVQYTIIYFDITLMQSHRYLMDKGDVTLQNFGGTADQSSKSITLTALPANSSFSGLNLFYGISGLQCKQGATIALSASNQLYVRPNSNNSEFILTMYTFKLTLMLSAQYNFVQYASLNCGLPGANCDGSCLTSPEPHYVVNGVCNYCQSSCLTCNISNSNSRCDSCDATRYLSNSSGLCLCNPGYYDSQTSNVCSSCFPCLTCSQKGICNDCDSAVHLVLNTILDSCQCAPGFCANYVNGTATLNTTLPCLSCPENCLYCLNTSFCLACNTITYLNSKGQCIPICTIDQRFDNSSTSCSASFSSMYDQAGRLGYEWSYTAVQSQLVILLTFSQPDTLFYYYQNGNGYGAANSSFGNGSMQESANFYFDDGYNSAGYASGSSQSSGLANIASLGSSPANIFGNSDLSLSSSGDSNSASSVSSLFQQGGMQYSALNGSYYGLGEQQFIKYLYRNYLLQSGRTCNYYDANDIPFGKYNLSTNAAVKNPNFADALKNNIVFSINNETIPFTMIPLSNNQFQLTASVSKSYSGDNGYLLIKNPGLIRSGAAASQLTNASQSIYIYDCAIPSYVSAANNIYESNSIIVQVLWGLGKYPLFIGFGWIFMPLMLVMQFVMSLNYVSTTKPLNLDLFLASFADFRNPSIFYNPVRNNIDRSVIDHKPIYRSINSYNRFDRGIDFMQNCFQFFFVPFLSVILYALFIGLNRILNANGKDIPLISNYIKPRFPLHIAAYTLVQALPVSFFFFAQLNDTRYKSLNDPNSGYSIFNIAMSYLAFFLTCAIPLMVMTHVYFIYTTKENKVKSAKDFKTLFANLLQSVPHNHHIASLNDPLWTGDQVKLTSYGFGLTIYFLAIIYGFFISFFINDYPWQLTGLILATAGVLAFAAASAHFLSLAMKIFWIVFCALLLAFLFLLAGIGSNASAAPCDQQSLGYLGIGFLYALILAALMICCLLLWFTIFQLYSNYFKNKHFVVSLADKKQDLDDKPERVKGFQSGSKLKSTYMKNPITSQINIGSKVNIGSMNMGGSMHANKPNNGSQFQPNMAEELVTEDRMIIKEADAEGDEEQVSVSMKQKLIFYQIRPKTGEYVFIREKDRREFNFDENIGRRLKEKLIFIDNNQAIFDRDNQYLGHYENLRAEAQHGQVKEAISDDPLFTANERELIKKDTYLQQPIIRYTSSKELDDFDQRRQAINKPQARITNIYIINGEEYTKEGEDSNGLFIMRNNNTNQIRRVSPSSFQSQEQEDILEDNSLEKEMPKSDSNDGLAQKVKETFVSPQIENNKVVLQKQRKFRFNGQQYIDLGEDGGFFRLLNKNQVVEKVDREKYIKMALAGFESRLNLNGIDYDIDFTDQAGNIRLIEVYSKRPKIVTQEEFRRLKQQNQAAFRRMIGQEQGQKRAIKAAQEQANQITNLLLLQSKAGNTEISNSYTASNNFQGNVNIVKQTSTKSVKEIEIVNYPQRREPQHQQEEEEIQDEETIEKVLQKSPGPFQLLVVPNDKVEEVDGADSYQKDDAIQKIILEGKNVMQFMEKTERKHPRAALFMVDLSNNQEYRLI